MALLRAVSAKRLASTASGNETGAEEIGAVQNGRRAHGLYRHPSNMRKSKSRRLDRFSNEQRADLSSVRCNGVLFVERSGELRSQERLSA